MSASLSTPRRQTKHRSRFPLTSSPIIPMRSLSSISMSASPETTCKDTWSSTGPSRSRPFDHGYPSKVSACTLKRVAALESRLFSKSSCQFKLQTFILHTLFKSTGTAPKPSPELRVRLLEVSHQSELDVARTWKRSRTESAPVRPVASSWMSMLKLSPSTQDSS